MIETDYFFSNFIAIAIKATSIAQVIRYENSLFELLIENKNSTEFVNCDYKTFADVLIQETARNDFNNIYPGLGKKLLGEESCFFTNKLNVSIEVKVCENIALTKNLILKIVDNHENLAEQLSIIVHKDAKEFIDVNLVKQFNLLSGKKLSLDTMEMWIDPIDATQQYVNGIGLVDDTILSSDCECIKNATVLLGAYDKISGIPFAGVICQPFFQRNSDGSWYHSCYWGINFDGISLFSDNVQRREFSRPGRVITSYREVEQLSEHLNKSCTEQIWNVTCKPGAGFKLLSLLTLSIDCCIISKGSTYKWDTCGPHAILLSVGGGLVDYQEILKKMTIKIEEASSDNEIDCCIKKLIKDCQVRYSTDVSNASNSGGFIAYTNQNTAVSVIRSLL